MKNKLRLEDEWKLWQSQMASLHHDFHWKCRAYAVQKLTNDMREMECEGQGISSSDTNHAMFSLWKHDCDGDIHKFVKLCIQGLTE